MEVTGEEGSWQVGFMLMSANDGLDHVTWHHSWQKIHMARVIRWAANGDGMQRRRALAVSGSGGRRRQAAGGGCEAVRAGATSLGGAGAWP